MPDPLHDRKRNPDAEQVDVDRLRWLEENRAALDSYNEHIALNGVFSDGLRRF
jgi:post-segregation antitoxin (ccd killing protein)